MPAVEAPALETLGICQECGKACIQLEKCHVCKKAICPNCDIRGKQPTKPACPQHA
jgi:hypothetical protein